VEWTKFLATRSLEGCQAHGSVNGEQSFNHQVHKSPTGFVELLRFALLVLERSKQHIFNVAPSQVQLSPADHDAISQMNGFHFDPSHVL
jgi:hypothetical protein